MQLEKRYFVLKCKDLTLPIEQWVQLEAILEKHEADRVKRGKDTFDCLVIEQDWPEYEIAVASILQRTHGQPTEIEMHRADHKAVQEAGFHDAGELLAAYKRLEKREKALYACALKYLGWLLGKNFQNKEKALEDDLNNPEMVNSEMVEG